MEETYDAEGNLIAINGRPIHKRSPRDVERSAMKQEITKAIEASIDKSAVLAPLKIKYRNGFAIRGDKNDYAVDIVMKKEAENINYKTVYGSPMVTGIMGRVMDGLKGVAGCNVVALNGNRVRIAVPVGEYEIKVTRKKSRIRDAGN